MADESDFGDSPFGEFFPETFLFKTPLYDPIAIDQLQLSQLFDADLRLDGFCPFCAERRTFRRSKGTVEAFFDPETDSNYGDYAIRCTRHNEHRITFHYFIAKSAIRNGRPISVICRYSD